MAAAVATTGGAGRGGWIVSPAVDAACIIGAPLLIAPLLFGLSNVVPTVALAGFVLVTLSTAHHLPGFLRVYGDSTLFERYRMRFLLMPPLVLLAVGWITWHKLTAVLLIALAWGIWHGLMQVYGVMRIYAVKAGEASKWTPRLDRALCTTGFVAILLSGGLVWQRLAAAADGAGLFGLGSLLAGYLAIPAWGLFAVVAVIWTGHHLQRMARGQPVSMLKVATAVVSLSYLYLCWILAGRSLLLGLAAFEAFHDVQYMAVAWAYNHRLASRHDGNRMLDAVFGGGGGRVALYVLLIALYGGIAFATVSLSRQGEVDRLLVTVLAAFVASSGLLHFYFDGFIWKVRQAKTKRDLGVTSADDAVPSATGFPVFSRGREALQVVAVLLPILGLGWLGTQRTALELPIRGSLARAFPDDARLQMEYGFALEQRGEFAEALVHYLAAAQAAPDEARPHYLVGETAARLGNTEQAIEALRRSVALDPALLGGAFQLGNLLLQRGDADEAEAVLRAALEHAPDAPGLSATLARALLMDSSDPARISEAAHLALAAARSESSHRVPAMVTLARARAARGDREAALRILARAFDSPEAQQSPQLQTEIGRLIRQLRREVPAG